MASNATVVPDRVGPQVTEIGGLDELQARMRECETIRDWSFLLNDYIQWGNNTKVSKYVGIFNLGAADDCPNRWTERRQVGGDECYAVQDERQYDYVLDYMAGKSTSGTVWTPGPSPTRPSSVASDNRRPASATTPRDRRRTGRRAPGVRSPRRRHCATDAGRTGRGE
ncbi:hypothetical protein [Haloarcula sp. JP-L23]|uniref:hypothetical protein n=1 Tax=Haloarcula sp. JP-L23 TaxID=2716717 RepID=UPI00140EAB17|nr:hypothetical protein G9465_25335 [Haloarcula sp. JP-L23]